MMPEMDGIETTKKIREWEAEQNNSTSIANGETRSNIIIALTANAVSGQADMFLQNGFDDFISKPIDIRQLDTILNKHIRDKQPAEVINAARSQILETSNENSVNIDSLLIESFIRDAKKTITWLDEQFQNGTNNDEEFIRKFTIIVHGIKSSLWNIGDKALADDAFKLETAGLEKNINNIISGTPAFVDNIRELMKKLVSERDKENKNSKNLDENIEVLHGKLKLIQKMSADYDRKGALDIITEIKHYSEETKAVLDIIMGHILHSEFEEAQKAAALYADKIVLNS